MTAHECDQCTFVGHPDHIIIPAGTVERAVLSPWTTLKILLGLVDRQDLIIELGRYALPGWNQHMMWYLYVCGSCHTVQKSYVQDCKAGIPIRLVCSNCGDFWEISQRRFFTNDQLPMPYEFLSRKELKALRLQEIERRKNFART